MNKRITMLHSEYRKLLEDTAIKHGKGWELVLSDQLIVDDWGVLYEIKARKILSDGAILNIELKIDPNAWLSGRFRTDGTADEFMSQLPKWDSIRIQMIEEEILEKLKNIDEEYPT